MQADLFHLNFDVELMHWWFTARRQILARVVEALLPPSFEHLVVEVGCGTGANTARLGSSYRVIGIDPSRDAVQLARSRYPHLQFIHGTAPDDLGDAARAANLFVLADVLEHVEDDFRLFSSLFHQARPGALFLITVPADPLLWSPHDERHAHFRRYDKQRLRQVWAGFPAHELLVTHFNARLYPVIKVLRAVSRVTGRASGGGGTDIAMPGRAVNRMLHRVFAGEQSAVLRSLGGGTKQAYRRGASLMAVVRRESDCSSSDPFADGGRAQGDRRAGVGTSAGSAYPPRSITAA